MEKRVTIKDIAKRLNISTGTVDRAIHGRGRISGETRRMILDNIEELGYRPNRIAGVLSKNKVTRLVFVTPSYNLFFEEIIKGARTACEELADYGVVLDLFTQDSFYDSPGQVKAMEQAINGKPSGIIVVPLHPFLLSTPINKATEDGIPVITVNLDSKESKRVCYVGQDPFNTGTILGAIYGKFMGGKGDIAVLNGITELYTLQARTEGFLYLIRKKYPGINIAGIYEYADSIDIAYEISRKLVSDLPALKGIFASTTLGAIGIGKAMADLNKNGDIAVVGYDIYDDIKNLLDNDALIATVTQNPFSQGYYAVKLMFNLLIEKKTPEKEFYYTRADVIVNSIQHELNIIGL